MSKQQSFETLSTPVGKLIFPNFNVARDYQGDGKFKYDAKIRLDESDPKVQALIQAIDIELESSMKDHGTDQTDGPPYEAAQDRDRETKEFSPVPGFVDVKVSVPAVTETKKGPWKRKPKFFDASGKLCAEEPRIGAGTEAKIYFQFFRWKMGKRAGVTLQPVGVQIARLVEGGGAAMPEEIEAIGGDFDGSTPEGGVPPMGADEAGGSSNGTEAGDKGDDF